MAQGQTSQIPKNFIEHVRAGRAALVVGSSIGTLAGLPSWKKILERLRDEIEKRGQPGDVEAAEDVSGLLKKGRLVQAASFLARTLGGPACDALLADAWKTPTPLPQAIRVLGRIPVKAVWTAHSGGVVQEAVLEGSPEGWTVPRVASYENVSDIDIRRRHVLELLGDVNRAGSYVLVPTSVRRALSSATAYRTLLQDFYRNGSLLFIGFRHGDPDLHAILDRVFGSFEPPQAEHYFVGAGLSPVDIDELHSEHHMTVIPLEGQGGDDKSAESILRYLNDLADLCVEEGLTLAASKPSADDLEGWRLRLEIDPADAEAHGALLAMEGAARGRDACEELVEILLTRVEFEGESKTRATLLCDVARTLESRLSDKGRALTAFCAALRDDPGHEGTLADIERVAAEIDGWAEVVGDLSPVVPQIHDKNVAAELCTRLGHWYADKLRHYDYAQASYRQALEHEPAQLAAHEGLEDLFRRQQMWGELANELTVHAQVETKAEKRVDLFLSLGDLYENQLASTAKAVESYEKALDSDAKNADTLAALERLYRRDERWGKLATVLERRAEALDSSDPGRASSYRRELASIRSEKLGDLEGAIGRYEAALSANPRDLDALRALEKLYEKSGNTDAYLGTLERIAEIAPESERAGLWRRLAAEVEEREGGATRAIRYYETVLGLESGAKDAFRSLQRLYRAERNFDAAARLIERQITNVQDPADKAALYATLGRLLADDLRDPRAAVKAHLAALDASQGHLDSLSALGELHQRLEAWDSAVDVLSRHAALLGPEGAQQWYEAGEILSKRLHKASDAESLFCKALEVSPTHLPAMHALIEHYRRYKNWARAAQLMLEAETVTHNRLEKVQLLFHAATMNEDLLDSPDKARDLFARVLALDPEHAEAGARLVEHLVAAGLWIDAEPVLDMLVRHLDPNDKVEGARRESLLARAAEAAGHSEKAAKHYRLAVEADPDSLDAALGLAGLLYLQKEWAAAERHFRDVLAKHRPSLTDVQVVDTWYRIGNAARQRGDAQVAADAYRRALEIDSGHRASLLSLVELSAERNDWPSAVEAKRTLLEGAEAEQRFRLHEEIGDILLQKLGEPGAALNEYAKALDLRPASRIVLHKVLEIHTAQKRWPDALATLDKLVELERDPETRAKMHYAGAVIARDELGTAEQAMARFDLALDDVPTLPKAFDAIERLLRDREDWKGLSRALRRMIKRLGAEASEEILLPLWTKLGDVTQEKLSDHESAMAAYEVAVTLDPTSTARHEQLAALYLAAGPDRADKAITELQLLVKKFPDRLSLYRGLSKLYSDTKQDDKAYCLAAALVFLGAAADDEKARFAAQRQKQTGVAKRKLTEELWQKSIIHSREDRALNGIFASLMASLAAVTAQPHQALDLNPAEQADPEKSPLPLAKMFRYTVATLGLSQPPELYVRQGGNSQGGIQAANIADKGVLVPAVLIGESYAHKKSEREVAFAVAKKLSFFRPERYVVYALPTVSKLQAAVEAALAAAGVKNGRLQAPSVEIERLTLHLQKTVPAPVLDQVAALGRKLASREAAGVIESWVTATDLTGNRVGLILSNDLEASARAVATEQGVSSSMSAKERLRELLLYSVSEEYFGVRKYLGLEVGG